MINGIELLKKIKNNELKLNQKINVYYDNKDVAYDLVAILTYKGKEVIWTENTFRFSMLYDDNYLFEIIEDKKIEKLSRCSWQENGVTIQEMVSIDAVFDKVNELIDVVNELRNEVKE